MAGVFVECPPGKVVVGVGFETRFGEGHVAVTEARPNGRPGGAPTSVVVTAREIDPFPSSWTVFGYATCADPLPGLVKVSTHLAWGSDRYRGAFVRCPAGKQLVGTGFDTFNTDGQVIVDDFIVGNSGGVPTMLYLGAYEEEPYLPNWTMAVYAICADPVPGLERLSATRVGTGPLSPLVACPIGKVPLGGGFEIHSAPANGHQTLLAPVGTREVIGIAEEEDPSVTTGA
jgi:hypothetical protein